MAKCVFCGKQCNFHIVPAGGGMADKYPAHKKCDREYRSKKVAPQRLYAEGNNGGDYFDITLLDDDTARLEVGHCCVIYIDEVVPVEFITSALAKAVCDKDVKEFIKGVGWTEDFTKSLISKIKSTN